MEKFGECQANGGNGGNPAAAEFQVQLPGPGCGEPRGLRAAHIRGLPRPLRNLYFFGVEDRVEYLEEIFGLDRLREKRLDARILDFVERVGIGESAYGDDLDIRSEALERADQRTAVHVRHHHVSEDKAKLPAIFLDERQGLDAVPRRINLVSVRLECLLGHFPD